MKASNECDVLIIDGYNLIYRSKYSHLAKNRDKNSIQDRSIVFSFVKSLRSLINQFSPKKTYFVLEGLPKKRLELDSSYKGTRVYEKDTSFSTQRSLIKNLLNFWPNLTTILHEDHECDDVISELSKKYQEKKVVIVSNDTDFIQLLNYKNVKIWNGLKKNWLTIDFDPNLYVNFKSLKGDTSDNIIGFEGIGKIRALNLVKNENALQAFLNENNNKEKFELNKTMIQFEVVDLEKCKIKKSDFDIEKFKNFFIESGFESIIESNKWELFIKPLLNVKGEL